MAEGVLVDNDVLIKCSAYRLGKAMFDIVTIDDVAPAMLGVARFVVPKAIERAKRIRDIAGAAAAFVDLAGRMRVLEPTPDELTLAAELETTALTHGLELDTGESQLIAVIVTRGDGLVLTGDKRAIAAAAVLEVAASGRIACLEQLFAEFVRVSSAANVCPMVCSEPEADRALSICFRCTRQDCTDEHAQEGLSSYIRATRHSSGNLLLPGDDLSALTA